MTSQLARVAVYTLVLTVAGLAGHGVAWGVLDGTTSNPGNSATAGSVSLGDDDSANTALGLSGLRPGTPVERCVAVTYDGSLDAEVRLYGSSSGALTPHLNVTIARGTGGSSSSCSGFSSQGDVYSGRLDAVPGSWSAAPADALNWTQGQSRTYRFTFSVANDPAAQGLSAQPAFTWEARER